MTDLILPCSPECIFDCNGTGQIQVLDEDCVSKVFVTCPGVNDKEYRRAFVQQILADRLQAKRYRRNRILLTAIAFGLLAVAIGVSL